MRMLRVILLLLLTVKGYSQGNSATVSGLIIDEEENAVAGASVTILGRSLGIAANDSGQFSIRVPAQKAFALIFSHAGFSDVQKNFFLSKGENETVTIRLYKSSKTLQEVIVKDDKERYETGLTRLNPRNAIIMPSTTGGVESMIKTLVGSNNELSSQYNVRGGSYDENLIYINDFEVYRPYLVSSGQQEGLSLINPELTRNIQFYTGGFQARYGDKMSSVLDIQYKRPQKFSGSAYVGLLEQGIAVGGSGGKGKFTYLAGVRNRSNRNLLKNQPTQGSYIPAANDAQGYVTYKFSDKLQGELLGILSTSTFSFFPESVQKTASVFSPLYSSNLGLDVYFDGQERDRYKTSLLGASIIHSPNKHLKLKWMLSRFSDDEQENFDIGGTYLFGERDFDKASNTFGQIINPLGAGFYQDYARNKLNIQIWNASHRGSLDKGRHFLQWGAAVSKSTIKDVLKQWQYQDSAGYSLPHTPGSMAIFSSWNTAADLNVQQFSAYLQDNLHLNTKRADISLQIGSRINYNDLNKQTLVSPRLQLSFKPMWKRDMVFKFATGLYSQPPFYREMRRYNGSLNTQLKAQQSVQFVGSFDYNFKGFSGKVFRFTAEAYYKNIRDAVTYDVDNVKIRYAGENNAKAYATGIEFRLFGELVKDAESWFSVAFMRTRENLNNDVYYQYKNAAGEIIGPKTEDQVVADSVQQTVGWLRRPTDRLITAGLYLEDYLSTNKNLKVHLNLLYGTNMSYNIPGSVRYRNGLVMEPYIRADIGFSVLLLNEQSMRRSHNPFRKFDNIWASLEIFNLIDRANTISFQLIKDFSNTVYAIPNRLTPRLVNLKLLARF